LLGNFNNVMRTRRSQFSGNLVPSAHQSVLLQEAIDSLVIAADDVVVDATLGGAGHAKVIAKALGKEGVLIGFDLDADAIERARKALVNVAPAVHLIEANFRNLQKELEARGIKRITKALFDLGWSSYQLDSGRGFSFQRDEPLSMAYSKNATLSAATIVNEWAEESIADIVYGFGEERYARKIAKRIVERRAKKPFTTSSELGEFIREIVPPHYRRGRIHPATRTFQALRIAVNDELGALTAALQSTREMLMANGRIAVITFHSLEDRLVKQAFRDWAKAGEGSQLTKKPITPTSEETAQNPRSRSGKLRVFEKT